MVATESLRPRRARACSWPSRCFRARAAFTLIEMLVVVAIISVFVGVIGFGLLRGSANSTVGLQSAQSMVVGLLMQARSQAIMTGDQTGVFVAAGPTGGFTAGTDDELRTRYLRCLTVARNIRGRWEAASDLVFLPDGIYVVPEGVGSPRRLSSELKAGESWYRCNDSGVPSASQPDVDSSALDGSVSQVAPYSETGTERWIFVSFSPRGTKQSAGMGTIALATGVRQPASNEVTPVILSNPDNVRGVAVSTNGQIRSIDARTEF